MHTYDDTKATDMSCGFGQRRHACKIVNLRQPNVSWLEEQGRAARAMGISVSLLGMASQSRPAYACSCIPAAIHHPDPCGSLHHRHFEFACLGRNTKTPPPPPKPRHRSAMNMFVGAGSWYYLSTIVTQVRGIDPSIFQPASATARTHARAPKKRDSDLPCAGKPQLHTHECPHPA